MAISDRNGTPSEPPAPSITKEELETTVRTVVEAAFEVSDDRERSQRPCGSPLQVCVLFAVALT
jgi:hypothetical protein